MRSCASETCASHDHPCALPLARPHARVMLRPHLPVPEGSVVRSLRSCTSLRIATVALMSRALPVAPSRADPSPAVSCVRFLMYPHGDFANGREDGPLSQMLQIFAHAHGHRQIMARRRRRKASANLALHHKRGRAQLRAGTRESGIAFPRSAPASRLWRCYWPVARTFTYIGIVTAFAREEKVRRLGRALITRPTDRGRH